MNFFGVYSKNISFPTLSNCKQIEAEEWNLITKQLTSQFSPNTQLVFPIFLPHTLYQTCSFRETFLANVPLPHIATAKLKYKLFTYVSSTYSIYPTSLSKTTQLNVNSKLIVRNSIYLRSQGIQSILRSQFKCYVTSRRVTLTCNADKEKAFK